VTGPLGGGSLGDAYINVHARTDDVEPDVRKGLDNAGKNTEKDADRMGTDIGDHIGKGIEDEVGRHGKKIGKSIGDAVEKEVIDVKPNLRYNVRGKDGRFIKRTAEGIASEVETAFSKAVSDGGIFAKIGQALSDAIGSSFNISGKSPLIVGLIPVIGAVIGLVGALLQALNAVAAVATTLPALFAAIGLQAGVLFLAFKGVGTAIGAAFDAKNAKELNLALVGLQPTARAFVRSLLPLKDIFNQLQQTSQQNFFKGFGNAVMDVVNNLAPLLKREIGTLAFTLGTALKSITEVFAGPEFKKFISDVIPATEEWLSKFGPAFGNLLLGFIKLGDSAIPLLSKLGGLLNSGLSRLGDNLIRLSESKSFQTWLDQMFRTLQKLGPLLAAAFGFIVQFLSTLNNAGGDALITNLTTVLGMLTAFLASEAGLRAMNELIGLAIASFYALTGAAIAVLFLLASIQAFVTWFTEVALPAVNDAFVWFGLKAADVVKFLGDFFATIGVGLWKALQGFWMVITAWFVRIAADVATWIHNVAKIITGLPQQITGAIGDLGNLLVNAGRNLIQGLIRGINNAIPGLRSALNFITNLLPDWKGPEEKDRKILRPAGEAVMQGFGEGIASGAKDIQAMLGDFTTGLGGIGVNQNSTHILFGANALQVNFRGALPTQNEATATGTAVGAGISSQLAARNTRLAVRTL
jgi:phage-related protein